jgi:hypothetical protein
MVFDLTISPVNRKLRLASHGNGAFQRDLIEGELVAVSPVNPGIETGMKVWPNPAEAEVTISFVIMETGSFQINLYDTGGRLLRSKKGKGRKEETVQTAWNLSDLLPGSYFLELRQGRFQQSQSLIIQ